MKQATFITLPAKLITLQYNCNVWITKNKYLPNDQLALGTIGPSGLFHQANKGLQGFPLFNTEMGKVNCS